MQIVVTHVSAGELDTRFIARKVRVDEGEALPVGWRV
jgi:hypothetical protein